jgi:translation initiation factor 3 subunit I
MRPILLSGHERALTQVKYNSDGDIIFTVSKDHVIVGCPAQRNNGPILTNHRARGVSLST